MMPVLVESRPARPRSGHPFLPKGGRLPTAASAAPFRPSNRNLTFLMRRDEQAAGSGVQLPLLAPMLTGLRLRSGTTGPEFILPNPSGGRGVYVTSWPVVTGFATPCLHDTLLVGRLSGRKRIGPEAVRDAARWVAREGHAGEAAADAAHDVEKSLRIAELRLGGQLVMAMARRAGFNRTEDAARCLSRGGFNLLAGRLGWHGPELAEAVRGVSAQHASVAIAGGPDATGSPAGRDGTALPRTGSGRWGRLACLMQRFRTALAQEQSSGHGADGTTIGRIIAAADQCLALAGRLLPEIDSLHVNPMPLLEAWRDGQVDSAGWLQELEAAFDGWARVCLLWFDTDTPGQRQAVVAEMAILTRTVGNAETRLQLETHADSADHLRRLLERNERVRAREMLLDAGDA